MGSRFRRKGFEGKGFKGKGFKGLGKRDWGGTIFFSFGGFVI